MRCGSCGRENPAGSVFCLGCGKRLAESAAPAAARPQVAAGATGDVPCPRCGTPNAPHMRFCVGCGQRLAAPGEVEAIRAAAAVGPPSQPAPPSMLPPADFGASAAPAFGAAPAAGPLPVASAGPFVNAVVAAAAPPPVVAPGTTCWRCRGAGDPGAAFCKFCGARYDEAPGAVVQPQPAQPAPRVAPTPAAIPGPYAAPPAQPPPGYGGEVVQPGTYPAGGISSAYASQGIAPAMAPSPFAQQPGPKPGSQTIVDPPVPASATAFAQLVTILKDGSDGRAIPLYGDQSDVGRTEGDVILGDDPYLSPRHARIRRRGEHCFLRDLESVNGVYVRIREPVDLADGDMILLGQQVLRFEILSDGEAPLGPAMQNAVLVFGTPEAPRAARLVSITTEGIGRDVFHLYRDETVLGRENGDIVFTDDPFLSRRHCSITTDRATKRFVLRDLGSSNGTSVRCTGERAIASGDQFRVGRHLFRFDTPKGGATR